KAVGGGRGRSRNELRGQDPLEAPALLLPGQAHDGAHAEGHDLASRITDEEEGGEPAQVREVSHEHTWRGRLVEELASSGGIVQGREACDRAYAAHRRKSCREQVRRLLRPQLSRMEDLGDSELRALRRLRHARDLAPASVGERASGVLLLRLRLAVLHQIAVHPADKMIGRAARGEPGSPWSGAGSPPSGRLSSRTLFLA